MKIYKQDDDANKTSGTMLISIFVNTGGGGGGGWSTSSQHVATSSAAIKVMIKITMVQADFTGPTKSPHSYFISNYCQMKRHCY